MPHQAEEGEGEDVPVGGLRALEVVAHDPGRLPEGAHPRVAHAAVPGREGMGLEGTCCFFALGEIGGWHKIGVSWKFAPFLLII